MKLDDLLARAERAIERPNSKSAMHYRNTVTGLDGKKLIIKLIKDWQQLKYDLHLIAQETRLIMPMDRQHLQVQNCKKISNQTTERSDQEWLEQKL